MLDARARCEHAMDDAKICDGGGIDVEDRDSLGPPERNQVETVEAADDADHVNVVTPVRGHAFVVHFELGELAKRSVLRAVIRPVEHVFRMVVVHLPIEGSGCFRCHRLLLLVVQCCRAKNRPSEGAWPSRIAGNGRRVILPGGSVQLLVEVLNLLRPLIAKRPARRRGGLLPAVANAHGVPDQLESIFDDLRFGMANGDVAVARVRG